MNSRRSIRSAPWFHIFIGRAIPLGNCSSQREDCASCHFDLQHEYIPWAQWYANVDLANTLSFTLPLNLPSRGGGLMYWPDLTVTSMREYIRTDRFGDIVTAAHRTLATALRYTIGNLVLHDGHTLHQMAGVSGISVTDERITLQGHGVFAEGAWRLYW
jgi:hypothetical protein